METEPEDFNTQLTKATTVEDLIAMFPDIKPTQKELFAGYCEALKLANFRIENEKRERRAFEKRNQRLNISFSDFKNEVRDRCIFLGQKENFEFSFDEHNRKVFDLMALYFYNSPEFENHTDVSGKKYSLKKGLLIQSPTRGTGKSVLLRAFNYNPRSSFYYVHISTLRKYLMWKQELEFERSVRLNDAPTMPQSFYQNKFGMMYDELFGEEGKTMAMGSNVPVSAMIIESLYDQVKGQDWFWKFHATTNYDGSMIEEKFGATIRSRVSEMFNLIKLEGPDRRKS